MSDITWIERGRDDPVQGLRWVALRNHEFLGRITRDQLGWFWLEDLSERHRRIELTGLTTIEEAPAAATLLLTLKQS
jgi:hypothetical protein